MIHRASLDFALFVFVKSHLPQENRTLLNVFGYGVTRSSYHKSFVKPVKLILMECNGDTNNLRENERLFRFCIDQMKLIEPTGNRVRNYPCPVPRSGHRIVVFNGNVFAVGGYNPREPRTHELLDLEHRRLFKELWKFNFASKTWINLVTSGSMPPELLSHAAVLVDDYMLVHGGTGIPFGQSSSNKTHLCNLSSLEWYTLPATGDEPRPLYGQAIALHNNKLYVIGGTTGYDYTISVHCLDLYTKIWSRLDNLKKQQYEPSERYRHEIAIFQDKIFVFGGGTVAESFDFIEIPVFCLTDYTWKKVVTTTTSTFPEARYCHGLVQIRDEVYICGGQNNFTIFSDVWKISLEQLQWQKLKANMPLPLFFHSVAISQEGQLFVFGGVTNTEEEIRTNAIFSAWLKIPSLSIICWQAVLFYIPHIAQLNKQKLYEAGVPVKYLDQIDFYSTEC